MNNIFKNNIKKLINSHDSVVDFGSSDDAPADKWFDKAEKKLGVKLSESYKWFLQNYSGGEIGGEEIFSIYGVNFEDINGGDIVFQHITNLKNRLTETNHIVVSETDFGEVFFFNYTKFDGVECPIYLRLPSGNNELYANDFYDFLQKRIEIHVQ